MVNFDPFAWFYNAIGYVQEQWHRLAIFERIRRSAIFERIFGAYLKLGVPSIQDSTIVQRTQESGFLGRLADMASHVFHLTLVAPVRGVLGLLGLSFEWLVSRTWLRIALNGIPAFMLATTALLAWWGGNLDRMTLAESYFERGKQELSRFEVKNSERTSLGGDHDAGKTQSETAYAGLIFNRVLQLVPTDFTKFQVGTLFYDAGLNDKARKVFARISSVQKQGPTQMNARVFTAASHLSDYFRTQDKWHLDQFQFYAERSIQSPLTPKAVFVALCDLQVAQGSLDRAVSTIKLGAERYSDLYPKLVKLAGSSQDFRLANSAKQQWIAYLQNELAKKPEDVSVRVQLAQSFATDSESLSRTEQLLKEGIEIESHPVLVRALSEVYRVLFVRKLMDSGNNQVDLNVLDLAFQTDPTNPLIADQINALVTSRAGSLDELVRDLNRILVSGTATTGTHALLAEIYLAENQVPRAIFHLQQVMVTAPAAIKYADSLVRLYAKEGKLDDAMLTGQTTMAQIEKNGVLRKERYVDGLLHSMGTVYLSAGRDSEAAQAFERALEATPNRLDTRDELVRLYRRMGENAKAELHEKYAQTVLESISTPIPSQEQTQATQSSNGNSGVQ